METNVIKELREKTHCVIATGGGLPLRKENSDLLKEVGTVYYLMADADTTYARVKHCTNRPLLQCDDPYTKIQAMMKERGPVYARACHIRVRTDHGTLEEVMDEIK
ncbi:MAG: shikimate kinase [Coprococcus sp.]